MNATHRYWADEGKDPKTKRVKSHWVIACNQLYPMASNET